MVKRIRCGVYTILCLLILATVWQALSCDWDNGGDTARQLIGEHAANFLFSFLCVTLGIILFLVMGFSQQMDRKRLMALAVFSVSVGVWFLMDPRWMCFFLGSVQLVTVLSQICQMLMIISITGFACTTVTGKTQQVAFWLYGATLLGFGTVTVCQLCGVLQFSSFAHGDLTVFCGACLFVLVMLLVEKAQNRRDTKNQLLAMIPLVVSTLGDQLMLCMGNNYAYSFLQAGALLFLGIQTAYICVEIRETIRRIEQSQKLENELLESRMNIMLSQIQPHFIYNALGVIRELCLIDAKLAEKATLNFSGFLRGNIDSLMYNKPIPFEQELAHTKNYLALELLRFGKMLNVVYHLDATDFYLPTLTLQPIVENAVRYGVTKRENGGTVAISTYETKKNIVITVTDDGVGFAPELPREDGRTHIGIDNVRERLSHMCGGTLKIKSIPDEGTVAIITLPKEGS